LIAEEVAQVNPDLVLRDKDGEILSVRYDAVNAMLLNEFLKEYKRVGELKSKAVEQDAAVAELKSTVTKQEAIIAKQEKGMELLTAQVKEQTSQIEKVSARVQIAKPAPQVATNKD
jgi:uncharacterized coiled-coil protein SlyX